MDVLIDYLSTLFFVFLSCFLVMFSNLFRLQTDICNRPFSYSEKESQSNDTLLHFVEFSNEHNSDRSSNATRSNLVY